MDLNPQPLGITLAQHALVEKKIKKISFRNFILSSFLRILYVLKILYSSNKILQLNKQVEIRVQIVKYFVWFNV